MIIVYTVVALLFAMYCHVQTKYSTRLQYKPYTVLAYLAAVRMALSTAFYLILGIVRLCLVSNEEFDKATGTDFFSGGDDGKV